MESSDHAVSCRVLLTADTAHLYGQSVGTYGGLLILNTMRLIRAPCCDTLSLLDVSCAYVRCESLLFTRIVRHDIMLVPTDSLTGRNVFNCLLYVNSNSLGNYYIFRVQSIDDINRPLACERKINKSIYFTFIKLSQCEDGALHLSNNNFTIPDTIINNVCCDDMYTEHEYNY